MAIEQQYGAGERFRLGAFIDRAERLVQAIALPSLVQFVMRVALAVPFWKSGILKWNGFLKLSDVAVTLFTDEFVLHLPGGPYHYPAPTVMAFRVCRRERAWSERAVVRAHRPVVARFASARHSRAGTSSLSLERLQASFAERSASRAIAAASLISAYSSVALST